jgi:hypothetical protein
MELIEIAKAKLEEAQSVVQRFTELTERSGPTPISGAMVSVGEAAMTAEVAVALWSRVVVGADGEAWAREAASLFERELARPRNYLFASSNAIENLRRLAECRAKAAFVAAVREHR